jgi:hypothetical protein
LPAIAFLGAFLLLMVFSEITNSGVAPEPGTLADHMKGNRWIPLSSLGMMMVSSLTIATGLIVSVISPKKGLVDYLLRTQLMPK